MRCRNPSIPNPKVLWNFRSFIELELRHSKDFLSYWTHQGAIFPEKFHEFLLREPWTQVSKVEVGSRWISCVVRAISSMTINYDEAGIKIGEQ